MCSRGQIANLATPVKSSQLGDGYRGFAGVSLNRLERRSMNEAGRRLESRSTSPVTMSNAPVRHFRFVSTTTSRYGAGYPAAIRRSRKYSTAAVSNLTSFPAMRDIACARSDPDTDDLFAGSPGFQAAYDRLPQLTGRDANAYLHASLPRSLQPRPRSHGMRCGSTPWAAVAQAHGCRVCRQASSKRAARGSVCPPA